VSVHPFPLRQNPQPGRSGEGQRRIAATRYDERGWRATFFTTGDGALAHERDWHRVGSHWDGSHVSWLDSRSVGNR